LAADLILTRRHGIDDGFMLLPLISAPIPSRAARLIGQLA
jgi:hypothetical protein